MKLPTKSVSLLAAALAVGATAHHAAAAAVAFYTDADFGAFDTPNANSWGGSNKTNSSVIFEVFIDFTSDAAAATDPITLFELGADAIGSGIAIDGDNIFLAAGGSSVANTGVATGPHGLVAGTLNVQIVAVIEYGAGTAAGEDLLSLYVNGNLVASADTQAGGDWAGVNNSNLGASDAFQIFEYVPSINPNAGDGANNQYSKNYPNDGATIEFAAYEFGVGDNTVENILVSPSSDPFAITAIDYHPDTDQVSLTWRNSGASSYIAKYSTTMTSWDADMEDGLTDVVDENPGDPDTITVTFDLASFGIESEAKLFFRIEEEE